MKKFVCLIMIAGLIAFFESCQKEILPVSKDPDGSLEMLKNSSAIETKKSEYNKYARKFAKALAKSMDNKHLRKMIKDEAMVQIDGDYDIIWKDFKNKDVQTKNGHKYLKELISDKIDDKNKTGQEKLGELEVFNDNFKMFQIAVPVHCEEWDTDNYQPLVTYLPADYNEDWEEVEAYDKNGKIVKLSNKEEPDVPVIVIGLNERSNEEGEILKKYSQLKSGTVLDPPTNLIANAVNEGIYLSWDMPTNLDEILGYRIQRKGPNDYDFSQIAELYGVGNTTYTDISVEAFLTYTYKVVSFNYDPGVESVASNTAYATAPNYPDPVTSFDVTHVVKNEAKLNWVNNNSQYITETHIKRYKVLPNEDYELLAVKSANDSYHFDRNLTPGITYEYMITHLNEQGESSGYIDEVRIPYRDIQSSNPVYVKNISFTDGSCEGFLAGKPEFRVNVLNVNRSTFKTYELVTDVDFDFSEDNKSCDFNNRLLINWSHDLWYDVMSISMVEYDVWFGSSKLTVSAKYGQKTVATENNGVKKTVDWSLGAELEIDVKNDHEDCGIVYANFYDNENITYYFQNYGASITISKNP